MKQLFLQDFQGFSDAEVREHIENTWKGDASPYKILIAAEFEDSYDGYGFFLLRHKETKELFEVNGSHCSCYGFEGQFDPKPVTLKYLKSKHFYVSSDFRDGVDAFIAQMRK